MPELVQRYASTRRSSSPHWVRGCSTRSSNCSVRRGSNPSPSEAAGTWYSSCPSCRLRICDEIATGASSSSSVTSSVITARCRSARETIRSVRTCTRLPDGVRHSRSRRSTPSRRSSARSYDGRSATGSSSGSSSTYSRITFVSGTLTMVWPTLANPYAFSACRIGHVSWKPLTNVPWEWDSRPSSTLPRMPR